MADPDDRAAGGLTPHVPQLIESYRTQREALRAQTRDLVRLRQEIRGSAEREAREIVEAARSNVRQILVNARRELLVLAAQVQAAIEEPAPSPDEAANDGERTGLTALDREPIDLPMDATDLVATRKVVVGARQGMHEIIDDARPHLDALADEARVLRGTLAQADALAQADVIAQADSFDADIRSGIDAFPRTENVSPLVADDRPEGMLSPAAPAFEPESESRIRSIDVARDTPSESRRPNVESHLFATRVWHDENRRASALPAALTLSVGRSRRDATVAPSMRAFVLTFAVLGTIVLVGTMWWLRASPRVERPAVAAPDSRPTPTQPRSTSVPTALPPAESRPVPHAVPVLSLQARRDVWVRTTVDGRADSGRLLHAGDTQDITGARDVAIRAGDAGALWVSLNGSPATRLGRDGEVLTRNFALQSPSSTNPARPKTDVSEGNETDVGTAPRSDAVVNRDPTAPASTGGPVAAASPAAVTPEQIVDSGPQTRESRARNLEPTGSGGVSESSADTFGIAEAADGRLVSAAERWLDAYYLGERVSGAGPQPAVKDDRTSEQRLPPRLPDVRRTLDDVRLQLVGDSALFTARMMERSQIGERLVTHNSLVSQMWMRSGGSWRLVDVRIVTEPRLQSGAQ